MTYPLCHQTVTVYRRAGESISRLVVEGCAYQWQDCRVEDELGAHLERRFLLILPGDRQQVFPGDRIYDGIGPEITAADWADFIPVNVPTLSEVAYAKPWYLDGQLCHVEAGRK